MSKTKAFVPLERDIQRAILAYLTYRRIVHFRVNTSGVMREGRWTKSPNIVPGVSDIIAILPGGWIWAIEVKRPGKKLSPEQEKFFIEVRKAGGFTTLATSVNDVKTIFDYHLEWRARELAATSKDKVVR